MEKSGLPAADCPVSDSEFSALIERLGPFEHRPAIAVAVSGGGDSSAAVVLAKEWVNRRGGSLLALVVDHGLRAESADEAARVVGRMEAAGIPARCLRWLGHKPRAASQAAAREARYELLTAACRAEGILHLLTGHHRDDQIETVALRGRAGSGRRGAAAMAAVRELRGLRLLRPLLPVAKSRLLATLRTRGHDWLDDPSNSDVRFARTALRRAGSVPDPAGYGIAVAAGRERQLDDRHRACQLAQFASIHPLGFLTLDLAPELALDAGLLARLIQTVGGAAWPPRSAALARLAEQCRGAATVATLGGCLLRRHGRRLVVTREPAAARQSLVQQPGSTVWWDRRFAVSLRAEAPPLTLRRLGSDGSRRLGVAAGRVARRLPAAAVQALPSLWEGSELVWHPVGGGEVACPDMPPIASAYFRPSIPLADAPFFQPNVVSMPPALIYLRADRLLPSDGEVTVEAGPGMRLGR